jgi:hypothetical protein
MIGKKLKPINVFPDLYYYPWRITWRCLHIPVFFIDRISK